MAYGYGVGFRERVVAAYEAGEGGAHEVAEIFGIGYRTVERWVARKRTTGSVAPLPGRGGWTSPIDGARLTELIREVPDATALELCVEYNRRGGRGQQTSERAISRARRRLGFVCKKNGRGRAKWIGPTWRRSARRFSSG